MVVGTDNVPCNNPPADIDWIGENAFQSIITDVIPAWYFPPVFAGNVSLIKALWHVWKDHWQGVQLAAKHREITRKRKVALKQPENLGRPILVCDVFQVRLALLVEIHNIS